MQIENGKVEAMELETLRRLRDGLGRAYRLAISVGPHSVRGACGPPAFGGRSGSGDDAGPARQYSEFGGAGIKVMLETREMIMAVDPH
jgi:hypothetical protein